MGLGVQLIEHEIMVVDFVKNEIGYIDYIDNINRFFDKRDSQFMFIVKKGTRCKDYYDYLYINDKVSVSSYYDFMSLLSRNEGTFKFKEYADKYAVIRYSTDNCYPNYRVEFVIKKKAIGLDRAIKSTYANPEQARNYHHDLVKVVRLVKGYRKPTENQIAEEVKRRAGYKYSPKEGEILASDVLHNSIEI